MSLKKNGTHSPLLQEHEKLHELQSKHVNNTNWPHVVLLYISKDTHKERETLFYLFIVLLNQSIQTAFIVQANYMTCTCAAMVTIAVTRSELIWVFQKLFNYASFLLMGGRKINSCSPIHCIAICTVNLLEFGYSVVSYSWLLFIIS